MSRGSRIWLRLILLGLAFTLGTYALGWWAVPAIGAAWGLMNPAGRRIALLSGVAATLAWAALLVVPAAAGAPTLSFGVELAASMRIPAWVLAAVELAFPFVLAWASSAVGAAALGRGVERVAAGVDGNPSGA